MDAEMASWKSTSTYVDEVPPPGANIVSGMWIFRVKRPPGSPPVFKARYVARGLSQRQGRDYELHSLDFSTAFLQGSLHEEIWLRRPPGFTGSFPPGTQWSLRRPVYGLRQAPREWHDTLRTTLAALGFAPSTADPSLFLRTDTFLPPFYILVYVDDLVFATADTAGLAHVKLVPAFVAGSGATSPTARLSFTLDSGASSCFFRDYTDLTPLHTPVIVALADPSVGSKVAESTTNLPCSAAPSGFLIGYYTPLFSRNLVGVSHLHDLGVVTTFRLHEPVASYTFGATRAPLATFHRELGSGLYSLHTRSHHTGSGQVRSGQVAAVSCDCRSLTHPSVLWHHRLGHPSFPRLSRMVRHRLVSGLLESLAPLPRSPAPPCTPCVEGRQRAAAHSSSFPPNTAPLQTLHLDVWGPSPVLGPCQERYFLIVVDDYSCYTTVFPLQRKADVPTVLEPWLLARGGIQGLCGLCLHSDRGGEFSSTRLETFCQVRGIIHSYSLPDSPQQNEVAKRRISLVMEVARTSMCHAGAPQFLWPQAVRYAAHQLNLWPSDAWPWVRPIFLWTGFPGIAADYRVWGCLAHVRAPGANKLSAHTCVCVFLGFPLVASSWVFYDPVTHQFFASQDVTFDDLPPSQRLVPVVSGGAGVAVAEGGDTGAAGAHRASTGGAGGVRVETTPEEDTVVSTQRPLPASPPGILSIPQFPPSQPPRPVAAEPGGVPAGGTGVPGGVVGGGSGSGGAGAGDTNTATPTPRTVRFLTRVQRLDRLEREERERFERARQQQQQQSQSEQEESQQQQQQSQSEHQERVEEESWQQQQQQQHSQSERQERVEEESRQQQGQVPLRPSSLTPSQQTPKEAERRRLRPRDLPDPAPACLVRGSSKGESFTLPEFLQQNGIAERHIGLVREVVRTSMIHVAAPHFLWPFAVRYAAHQLNLWPRVSLPETSPTLRWTGEVGDASVFRFYHHTSRRVFPSHDVTFDESVLFYRLFPYRSAPPPPPLLFLAPGPPPVDPLPPQGPAPLGVSQVDPLPGTAPVQVAVDSGAAQGAASGGAESMGAESGGAEPRGAALSGGPAGLFGAHAFRVELPELEALEPLELEVLELLLELVVLGVLRLLVQEVLVPGVLELPGQVVLGALELETLRSLEELELEALAREALELEELELEALAWEAQALQELELLTLDLEVLEALCDHDRTSFPCFSRFLVSRRLLALLLPSCC
ncbi:unnamed protein product [Closterium sp. NIES-53]